jgi:large subunit ribosomal protein L24
MRIKKGDTVYIRSGKDRGKTAKVLGVFLREGTVLVEGVNVMKKRERAKRQGQKGQVVSKAMPVAESVVLPFCTHCKKGVRVGMDMSGAKKTRICRSCKSPL